MKKLNSFQKAENVIKWLNALPRYKKTTQQLQRGNSYCCLGVACRVLGVPIENKLTEPKLIGLLGIDGDDGKLKTPYLMENGREKKFLTAINDDVFTTDKNFKNMRRFMLDHLKDIFEPSVARHVRSRYAALGARSKPTKEAVPASLGTGAKRSAKRTGRKATPK